MAVKDKVRLSTLSYIILYVPDTAKALSFYRDKLGLKVKFEEKGWVELESGNTTLALHSTDEKVEPQAKTSPIVVFGVDNIKESFKQLRELGIDFEEQPHEVCSTPEHVGYSADFTDPFGNRLSIYGTEPKK